MSLDRLYEWMMPQYPTHESESNFELTYIILKLQIHNYIDK